MGCQASSRKYMEFPVEVLDASNFTVDHYVNEGGMGKVFGAKDKNTGELYALKVFGYSKNKPQDEEIQREIDVLAALTNIKGVLQLKGIVLDTATGVLDIDEPKLWKLPLPVIVTEYLHGGSLYDRITRKQYMSENILRKVFKGFIESLQGIHERGFIHRDLKLANIVLETLEDDSSAKIIDLGCMVRLPQNDSKLYSAQEVTGTPGYIAPESLRRKEYSFATDAWQIGCVLYSMLSGQLPFHPDRLQNIYEGKYYPMVGPTWNKISDQAKKLVRQLLVVNPSKRLTLEQILRHRWLRRAVPEQDLGKEYTKRIKSLALKQRMRKFFVENKDLLERSIISDENVAMLLPFLKMQSSGYYSSPRSKYGEDNGRLPDMNALPELEMLTRAESSRLSVRTFKRRLHSVLETMHHPTQDHLPLHIDVSAAIAEESENKTGRKSLQLQSQSSAFDLPEGEIDFENFVDVLFRAGLKPLATSEIFDIFDIGRKGTISLREFLVSMLALQPPGALQRASSFMELDNSGDLDSDETVRLFFSMFDIDNSGSINREEFELAMRHLHRITPSTPTLLPSSNNRGSMRRGSLNFDDPEAFVASIDTVFDAMDVDNDGLICFEEFKRFYVEVLKPQTLSPEPSNVSDSELVMLEVEFGGVDDGDYPN